MMKLGADASLVGNPLRPGNRHALPGAAKVRGDLFRPLEGRIKGPGPGHGHVRFRSLQAPLVIMRHIGLDRNFGHAVVTGIGVEGPCQRAFGARAVVA